MKNFTVIGYGKLGRALALTLLKKGVLSSIISKHLLSDNEAKILQENGIMIFPSLQKEVFASEVFLISTNETEIPNIVNSIIDNFSEMLSGKVFVHHSGILGKAILQDLESYGAIIASAHPLQTFYYYFDEIFNDVYWNVETDEKILVANVIETIGGKVIFWESDDKKRAMYHSSAVVASNVINGILFFAKMIINDIGLSPKILLPLVKQTIENVFSDSDNSEFPLTGPIARGNIELIKKHCEAFTESSTDLGIYLKLIDVLIEISNKFLIITNEEKYKFIQTLKTFAPLE